MICDGQDNRLEWCFSSSLKRTGTMLTFAKLGRPWIFGWPDCMLKWIWNREIRKGLDFEMRAIYWFSKIMSRSRKWDTTSSSIPKRVARIFDASFMNIEPSLLAWPGMHNDVYYLWKEKTNLANLLTMEELKNIKYYLFVVPGHLQHAVSASKRINALQNRQYGTQRGWTLIIMLHFSLASQLHKKSRWNDVM